MQSNRFVLSDAQIKALCTVPLDILPGLGVGKTIVPVSIFLALKSTAGYTNFDFSFSPRIRYAPPSNSECQLSGGFDTVLASPTDLSFEANISPPTFPNFTDPAAINNRLQLRFENGGAGNLTGGNVNNTLTCTLLYYEAIA